MTINHTTVSVLKLQRFTTNRLNVGKLSTKRFKTSANEGVTLCTYDGNTQTDTHTQTDYSNPPPTHSG